MRNAFNEGSWERNEASHTHQGPIINTAKSAVTAFIQRVFAIMGLGLAITGLTSYLFAGYLMDNPELIMTIFGSGLRWVVMLAPFAFILVLSFGLEKLSYAAATLVFAGFALVMGISLSSIFLVYTGASIASTFFVTAGMFGTMAIIGYTTKTDLSKMGKILMMGLIGIIIASIINIFLGWETMRFIISIAGVVIFCGFTAYDMQRLKEMSYSNDNSETWMKLALMGALHMYLNFINLFLFLLSLMGGRD